MANHVAWDRWPEVDKLFARALEEPVERRPRFLADACGDDLDLLRTLSDLVTASGRAELGLAVPGDEFLRQAFSHPADLAAVPARTTGDLIGRYRLVRELGRGGMAIVYEAERADGTYDQRVALKLLRRGVDSADGARRFHVETRALSSLTHPNVARLLDAGTTEDGYPFLVMELVEGEPVTDWADRHRVPVSERLALFLQIADAVSVAHQHLVVHRDLKPSNVLVGPDGRVKLLDFGIAKLLEPEGVADTETGPTTRWMTPGYASPEQVLGRTVTTATDVHGLGVLLYELLAGRRPFGAEGLTGFELDKAVCEQTPPRLSSVVAGSLTVAAGRRTAPEKLARLLTGDLDAIVSKALRKEPGERYASVLAMAKEIQRHLAGFPIEARAGLRAYRVRKFVRRHWLSVGAAGAMAAVLLGSSLGLWRLQAATARAAARATEEAENARLVTGFLADVFRGRNPEQAPGDTITARDLLAWGLERVESEFAQRPALQAGLFQVLGSAYANLGLLDQSIELHRRAVELTRAEFGDRSDAVAERLLVLSAALRANRDARGALPVAREALELRLERLGADDPGVAEALAELARDWSLVGQPDSAEPLLRRAIEILRPRPGVDDSGYVSTLLALAPVRRAQGALDDAERLYDEAIPKFRALGGAGTGLAIHLNNHAFLLRTRGEFARAEPPYREALNIHAALHGRGHPNSLLVATNLAAVLDELGDLAGAEAVLRENLEAAKAQWPDSHWRVGAQHEALGGVLLRRRQWDEGLTHLGEARDVYREVLGARHLWTFFVEATMAAGHVARGRADLGQPYLDRFYQYRVEALRQPGDHAAQQDLINLLTPFVRLLEGLALDREAARFGALLSPPEPNAGEPSG